MTGLSYVQCFLSCSSSLPVQILATDHGKVRAPVEHPTNSSSTDRMTLRRASILSVIIAQHARLQHAGGAAARCDADTPACWRAHVVDVVLSAAAACWRVHIVM